MCRIVGDPYGTAELQAGRGRNACHLRKRLELQAEVTDEGKESPGYRTGFLCLSNPKPTNAAPMSTIGPGSGVYVS